VRQNASEFLCTGLFCAVHAAVRIHPFINFVTTQLARPAITRIRSLLVNSSFSNHAKLQKRAAAHYLGSEQSLQRCVPFPRNPAALAYEHYSHNMYASRVESGWPHLLNKERISGDASFEHSLDWGPPPTGIAGHSTPHLTEVSRGQVPAMLHLHSCHYPEIC
jgi:hypothetical protein